MKICSLCKQELRKKQFYLFKSRKGKLSPSCKDCTRLRERNLRKNNLELYRKKDKKTYKKNVTKILQKKKIRYLKHKDKIQARSRVQYALFKGEIKRPLKCEKCKKNVKLEAHHPDYSKPLSVIWLCVPCHRLEDFGKTNKVE